MSLNGGFLKQEDPQIIQFSRVFPHKPSIWGYPHFYGNQQIIIKRHLKYEAVFEMLYHQWMALLWIGKGCPPDKACNEAFRKNIGLPQHSWFISWKIPNKNTDDDWGSPMTQETSIYLKDVTSEKNISAKFDAYESGKSARFPFIRRFTFTKTCPNTIYRYLQHIIIPETCLMCVFSHETSVLARLKPDFHPWVRSRRSSRPSSCNVPQNPSRRGP